VRSKSSSSGFTSAFPKLKLVRRRLEKIWQRFHSAEDIKLRRIATNRYHAAITYAERLEAFLYTVSS
jgi:hypothetical protein